MGEQRSRGQVILIAGVGIAVTFIALALIYSTVAYTETLETRPTESGQTVLTLERAVEGGVGGLISRLNYYDYESYNGLHEKLHRSSRQWENLTVRDHASRGASVDVTVVAVTNGSHILQRSDRHFTNATGSTDWTLAADVTQTRRFRMNLTRSSLEDADDVSSILSKAYTVEISDGTNVWRVSIYEQSEDIVLEVQYPNGTTASGCRYAKPRVSVDITGGTVEGHECDLLEPFAKGTTAPYSIRYENGDQVAGKYTLIIDKNRSALRDSPYDSAPMAVRALYSATLRLSYDSEQVDYESSVVVEPERTPDGEPYDVFRQIREIVFVNASTGYLSSVHPDGTVTKYDATGVEAIGPKQRDFDDDGREEIPYVNSSGTLKLIDAANNTRTVATGASASKTLLGVGTWRGATSVYYVNTSDNGFVYRANWTGSGFGTPTKVLVGGNGVEAGAVAGVGDYNDDDDADLLFAGTSQNLHYIDGGGVTDVGRTLGQNNGIGVGAPRQFDGTGLIRVPLVDGSQNVGLLNYKNEKTALTSSNVAAKSPVAGVNWVGAGAWEVVYLDASTGELKYVTLSGSIHTVQTENGSLKADTGTGVA